IVCAHIDVPSMIDLFGAQQTNGFELTVVPAGPRERSERGNSVWSVDTGRMLDAIDESTAVVAVSHVLFRTSHITDAAAIARRARDVGATMILDTYQSAGIIPVDV